MEKADARYLPRLILAGAPKCGTTSVFDYLSGHPEICASSVKETYYLMDEGHPLQRPDSSVHIHGWGGYRRFFSRCDGARKSLEATPDYMYQRTPLVEIPKWPFVPKVFFLLRRPEDRIYSLFRFAQNNMAVIGKEMTFAGFVDAMDAQTGVVGSNVVLVNALMHSMYVDYLIKWRDVVGAANIGLFLFEDLVADPVATMQRICAFLDIDQAYYDHYEFAVSNRSFQVRMQWLHKAKKQLATVLPKGGYRRALSKLYGHMNIVSSRKPSSEEIVLSRLRERLAESNRRLAAEFHLDIDAW